MIAICAVALAACETNESATSTPADKPAEEPAAAKKPEEKPVEEKPPAEEPPAETQGEAAPSAEALMNPAALTEKAPDKFSVTFVTTEGDFTVDLTREWAPLGVDRFYNLVKNGYYTDIATFRVIDGFMAQFGIHGDPAVNAKWREAKIADDPVKPGISNTAGHLTYAMAGPNTRTVQLFINHGDNRMLDGQGFRPIGKVAGDGMTVVKKWYAGYGEGAPRGKGPDQGRVQSQGNEYLKKDFPELSYIKEIKINE